MKTFLRRRLWIVPIWLIAVLAIVGMAAAGWAILSSTLTYDISSEDFGPFTIVSAVSIVPNDGCAPVLTGQDVAITWAGLTGGEVCDIGLTLSHGGAGGDGFGIYQEISGDPAIAAADLNCGDVIAWDGADVLYRLRLTFDAALATPGTSYPVSYSFNVFQDALELPACVVP